jgi:hypothetical protein
MMAMLNLVDDEDIDDADDEMLLDEGGGGGHVDEAFHFGGIAGLFGEQVPPCQLIPTGPPPNCSASGWPSDQVDGGAPLVAAQALRRL